LHGSLVDLPEGHYVTLAIADNGTVMPPDVAGKALDPFFMTKGQGKGTGLGLSIVAAFARQAGGALIVSSDHGAGTTLTFYFPALEAPKDGHAGDLPALNPTGRETILVVDDRRDVGELMSTARDSKSFTNPTGKPTLRARFARCSMTRAGDSAPPYDENEANRQGRDELAWQAAAAS
jgi:Histidine kinase-, DNA gyrase B-, and HSP90-like ATPase